MPDSQLTILVEGLAFTEAPRWHNGDLYVSDFYLGRVMRLPGGRPPLTDVCVVPGQPSGLGWDLDGHLLVVSMNDRRLLRLVGPELRVVADLSTLASGPLNDMVIDAAGCAYIGGYGSELEAGEPLTPTRLIRVDPGGAATAVGEELIFPNGMTISSDGRILLVAETFGSRISAFEIEPDGQLSSRRTWATFDLPSDGLSIETAISSGATLPDGLALDEEGAVWVANAGGSGVLRVKDGEVVDRISTGELAAFAVALGGDDRRTMFVCAGPPLGRINPRVEHRACIATHRVAVPGCES